MTFRGHGDFSIGSEVWPGISKLIEECGEVLQVCGKLIAISGDTKHWDGTNLRERLETELGDLAAAMEFVVARCELNGSAIRRQAESKRRQYEKWHAKGDPAPFQRSRK